ncbi:hypothetical protein [Epinotia aporema granulovirus]|uniref:Ac75-like protein n=1 Tax=Epinotia aporema granulovirus TaxID=166056 RepID=K4ER70_9BBAC|nr:hypothetical protein [Epinotia aporema granulovirus]AER41529.1 hypothetical protein [Epinotia aporema granulovirus]
MNFEFLKDLVNLNPIKTSYIANNLRTNFNFIVDEHVKDKEIDPAETTLLQKFYQILLLFTNNHLDQNALYNLFGQQLDLTKSQFYYMYKKMHQDAYLNHLIRRLIYILQDSLDVERVKKRLMNMMDEEEGYTNIATFLMRECNNAIKIK